MPGIQKVWKDHNLQRNHGRGPEVGPLGENLALLGGFDVHFKFFYFVTRGYHSRRDAGFGEKGL